MREVDDVEGGLEAVEDDVVGGEEGWTMLPPPPRLGANCDDDDDDDDDIKEGVGDDLSSVDDDGLGEAMRKWPGAVIALPLPSPHNRLLG